MFNAAAAHVLRPLVTRMVDVENEAPAVAVEEVKARS
jgi:hypothetical protein